MSEHDQNAPYHEINWTKLPLENEALVAMMAL
jgi:hypothetical protein